MLLPLIARFRLARIGNDLLELGHGQDARHAKLADDKGRRALEAERGSLIVVTRDDGVDRLGVCRKVARGAIDIDPRAGKQFADARLGQLGADADQRLVRFQVLVLILLANAIRAATMEVGPRIGQSFQTMRTLPSS